MRARVALFSCLVIAVGILPGAASAHEERPVVFPSGKGSVPVYRTTGPKLVVCKPDTGARISAYRGALRARNERLLKECSFHNLQDAVDAVEQPGSRILLMPGVYYEKPSLRPLSPECRELKNKGSPLTYREQRKCPHALNVVAILGDSLDKGIACDGRLCDLQVEGTGARPRDVIVDGRFKRLNVIRADRTDGIYFRNFTVQKAQFNALYIMQTDGFVIDRMLSRWNDEYGFLTFASDHGLYKRCAAHGNGDGGLYPGSAAPHFGARPSIEIRRCRSFHNTIGVSGTAGDSLYVHHNRLFGNTVGVTLDSFFPHHPGLPQNNAVFKQNKIYSNNANFYGYYTDGTCSKPYAERGYEKGVVCPTVPIPVGSGVVLAGGNQNLFARNQVWDNWRQGFMQFWVPASFREEDDPEKQHDTSHFNRYIGNRMGVTPHGDVRPNGIDFWWDEEGAGNCWQGNTDPRGIQSEPASLPDCDDEPVFYPGPKVLIMGSCATWSRENHHPAGCDWMESPERPARE